ncbi:MAG: formylmethanofuran dehydrogenase subunit C [Rubripirellula sp.]
MSDITLTLKEQPTVPLEAEVVAPSAFVDLTNAEIRALQVFHGKRICRLDDFFEVEGEKSDQVHMHGDLTRVRMLGRKMSSGTLMIQGDVGMHLGSHMSGGHIEVAGSAGDWVGAEMSGGFIRVKGNAGGQIGAAYRGSLSGMRAGTIIVDGTAGLEVGMRMRRGTIVVGGLVRDFAGLQMKGGTIVMLSGAEIRTGAWMNRGTIISLQPLQVMPTFAYSGQYNPTFLNVYASHLTQFGISLPFSAADGIYQRFCGDMGVTGKGELLVWNEA